jgi:hypothetical protein
LEESRPKWAPVLEAPFGQSQNSELRLYWEASKKWWQDAGGGIIVCIGKGERRPNDHWVGDYRLVGPSKITVIGNKAVVVWKSAAAASKPAGRSVVVDLARARLEREWQSRAISWGVGGAGPLWKAGMSTSGFNGQGILHEPHPPTDASPQRITTATRLHAVQRLWNSDILDNWCGWSGKILGRDRAPSKGEPEL